MKNWAVAGLAAALWVTTPARAALVDIVLVVDESGSMSGEHAWIPGMVTSLNLALTNAGHSAQFGLVGFGNGLGGGQNNGRIFDLSAVAGVQQFGTAAQLGTAASGLVISGGTEDGYGGLNVAFGYTFRAGAQQNYILITDEDRDNENAALTFSSILATLTGRNALLNVVVDNAFSCSGTALGRTTGTAYKANGTGGFTTCTPAVTGVGSGTTGADYVTLALNSSGAAWDLNQLRVGGITADSFTASFVNIKVQEITNRDDPAVPEPSSWLMSGAGVAVALYLKRRRR